MWHTQKWQWLLVQAGVIALTWAGHGQFHKNKCQSSCSRIKDDTLKTLFSSWNRSVSVPTYRCGCDISHIYRLIHCKAELQLWRCLQLSVMGYFIPADVTAPWVRGLTSHAAGVRQRTEHSLSEPLWCLPSQYNNINLPSSQWLWHF